MSVMHSASGGHWFIAPVDTHMPSNTVQYGRFQDIWPKGWMRVCHRGISVEKDSGLPVIVGANHQVAKTYTPSPMWRLRGLILPAYDADPRIIEILALADKVAVGWESTDASVRVVAQVDAYELYGVVGGTKIYIATTQCTIFMAHLMWTPPPRSMYLPSQEIDAVSPERTERGAYRGWRKWDYALDYYASQGEPALRSLVYSGSHQWQRGWNKAQMGKGFFACSTVDETMRQDMTRGEYMEGRKIVGAVLHAGKLIRASKGNRAQWCLPECVILSPNFDTNTQIILPIAERYGMRVCTLDEAKRMPTGLVPYDGDPPPPYMER